MRTKIIAACIAFLVCGALSVRAQQATATQSAATEQRVGLEEQPVALDSSGHAALAAQLVTKALAATPDAPLRNVRIIIENRSQSPYTYVSGRVTFYDDKGVRCGEGLFVLDSLAPNEQAETDAPGLLLTCTPRSWRIVADSLLARTGETVKPAEEAATTAPQQAAAPTTPPPTAPTTVEVTVDDKVYNVPMGSTLDLPVKGKRVKITIRPAQ
ncbi:MAG TPA: FxLYD domain-containing protein [Pyrinomonadaceae bacterium]|nr:FxLYD domain-containing protein [Pyrinomonadaceae bacterium]